MNKIPNSKSQKSHGLSQVFPRSGTLGMQDRGKTFVLQRVALPRTVPLKNYKNPIIADQKTRLKIDQENNSYVRMNSISPFLYHVYNGDTESVLLSLNDRALQETSANGDTALHIAVSKRYLDITKLLLNNGADVNIQNRQGQTPLHYAAENNSLDAAELLFERGANVNICDFYGNEPLWTAVFNVKGDVNKHNIVRLLLKAGGRELHKNNAGRSPLDFATQVGNKTLIELLKSSS